MDFASMKLILEIQREELQSMLDSIEQTVQAEVQKDRRITLTMQIEEIDAELNRLQHNPGQFSSQNTISELFGAEKVQKDEQWLECVACTEVKPESETLTLPCEEPHTYCHVCIINLFDRATSSDIELYPPRCCQQAIPITKVKHIIGGELSRKAEVKGVELATRDRTYCFDGECAKFILPDTITNNVATCGACGKATCALCKTRYHPFQRCPENADDQQVVQLAGQEGWRQCPHCSELIELRYGCNHMTCRCGTQFCYVCGARWRTCHCPQWAEGRLFNRANEIVHRNVEREDHHVPGAARLHVNIGGFNVAHPGRVPARAPDLMDVDNEIEGAMRPRGALARARARARARDRPVEVQPGWTQRLFAPRIVEQDLHDGVRTNRIFQARRDTNQNFDVPAPQRDPDAEGERVRRQMEVLRNNHECVHSQRWRGVDPQAGGAQCELCFENTMSRMKECRRCYLLICERCRRNRIQDRRTV